MRVTAFFGILAMIMAMATASAVHIQISNGSDTPPPRPIMFPDKPSPLEPDPLGLLDKWTSGRCSFHLILREFCSGDQVRMWVRIPMMYDNAHKITVNPDGGLPDKWKELDSGIGTKSVWDIWTGMGSLWVAGQRGTGHVSFAYNGKCRWDSENYNEPMKHCGDCRAGGWTASELNCKTERKADTNADPKADLKDITERRREMDCSFSC